LPEPKTLSANQCWRDVEEEREAFPDLLREKARKMKRKRKREGRKRERAREDHCASIISTPRPLPLTGMP